MGERAAAPRPTGAATTSASKARRFWGTSMLLRRSARSGALPVWKLRKWLPAVLAAALGVGVTADWARAQSDSPSRCRSPACRARSFPCREKLPQRRPLRRRRPSRSTSSPPTGTTSSTGSPRRAASRPSSPSGRPGASRSSRRRTRKFTMGEVVDLLNEAMIQQKFILIRRQVSFYIHPSDEKLDPTVVPRIERRRTPVARQDGTRPGADPAEDARGRGHGPGSPEACSRRSAR